MARSAEPAPSLGSQRCLLLIWGQWVAQWENCGLRPTASSSQSIDQALPTLPWEQQCVSHSDDALGREV